MTTSLFARNSQDSTPTTSSKISVVVPIFNEVESLPTLVDKIVTSLKDVPIDYEIVLVDDGSQDGTTELLTQMAQTQANLKAVILRRNYGQTPAMAAGFNYASGEIIITMDGDLQNDPADIPRVLEELQKGYDVVSGWRKNRKDDKLTRLLPSKIANWVIGKVTGVKLHDYGCSLKAYRSEIVRDMNLYGELHRFLPALAFIEGARIVEMPVLHHARQFGKSKYGLGRTFRVIMDLMTVFFMKKFLTRPMHVFGYLGILSMICGFCLGVYLTILKIFFNVQLADRPLLILTVLLMLTGIQLFCIGVLGELLMRTYHESQNKPIYRVREIVKKTVEQ